MEKFTLADTNPILIISAGHQTKKWLPKKRKIWISIFSMQGDRIFSHRIIFTIFKSQLCIYQKKSHNSDMLRRGLQLSTWLR